jgi:hypothetical protein
MSGRLLRPSDVPPQLWLASTGTVCLPTSLVDSYIDVLNAHDLFALAQTHEGIKSAIGGLTKEDTEHHLATRFQNSSARALLTVLDPKSDLQNASDLVVHAFAGGDLGLLDIPCGTGVASVTLLSTFAELREQKVLPSEPLTVHVVFGDISPYALAYAEELLEQIRPRLRAQGIYVNAKYLEWDITNADATTAIIHDWMAHAPNCRNCFVVLANFSGILKQSKKFKQAKPQLGEIFRWAGQRRSTVVWIEPKTEDARVKLFPTFVKWFTAILPRSFAALWMKCRIPLVTECNLRDTIRERTPPVGLCLIRVESTK